MRILIIGNGGREHALAWKAAQSANVQQVFVAPGNAGTALEPRVQNIPISAIAIDQLSEFAKYENIALTIVGPEAPLAAGIVDHFQKQGLPCFGPSRFAAQLESSKAFSKDFMLKNHIPTAHYATFTEVAPALAYVQTHGTPIVIKADGLAAGKGVVIAHTYEQAASAIQDMLAGNTLGTAGHKIVIEEFINGEEASFIVMVDGEHALALATSQDHKARDNGDHGPNTGGMGAYSPAPIITVDLQHKIMQAVIYPTIRGMAAIGHHYTGFLYAGLMITLANEIKVLEFNCRLGDPETQPIMLRLKSDFVALCLAALERRLQHCIVEWDERPALGVVMAAAGYPQQYPQGEIIQGLDKLDSANAKVFHAGTALENNHIITAGGRVLCATALGSNIREAQALAYNIASKIQWPHQYYRTDIGHRAIARESIRITEKA